MSADQPSLYETVANRMQAMIEEGALRAGDRIPSVRRLHRQWSVSLTTVMEAYRLLESRGWVEARPRSGYYVRPGPRAGLAEPRASDPPRRPQRVRTDLVMRMHAELNAPDVVPLGAAAPELELLPHRVLARKVAEAMRRHPETAHGYITGLGHEPLRREIARRMVDAGCAVSPAEVVITGGAQEALHLGLRAITRPGDMVAVESPCYFGLLEILETLDLRALEIRTHPRHGIDLDALEDALRGEEVRACALVTSFSNPLGCCLDDANKQRLAGLLARYQVPLVEDDIYGDLPFTGPRPRAVKAFDRDGLVLYASSFSKTVSPGFRIGWMVPGRYRDDVLWRKNILSISAPSLPQLALASYLADGGYDHQLRRLRKTYRDTLARAIATIGRCFPPGTRASQPRGGQVLWLELPRRFDAVLLYEQASAQRISIAPGVLFSAAGRYTNCLRLNLALRYGPRVEAALETLGRLAAAQLAADPNPAAHRPGEPT